MDLVNQPHAPTSLYLRKETSLPVGVWVGLRRGLDVVVTSLDPAGNQTLVGPF